ncbi:hypothetical protein BC937DRAFT_90638 [Endogone sp. FLAS-F59071]|nr:hypothetical protein BC937DRAFT_90638 [Endogone sp. FLAS-F59071]|eukprot:RUS16922.1 hypothetical protein BC937DRAFT_90638 [Endogone sp. FLAS-F59071]
MSWKEREMDDAIDKVVNNVYLYVLHVNASPERRAPAKTDTKLLVCSGARGIGKTRYGLELYTAIGNILPTKILSKYGIVYEPSFIYLASDFGNGARLREDERTLSADKILALRLAYYFFIDGKYDKSYAKFLSSVKKYWDLFQLEDVIKSIRENKGLSGDKKLFIFLHIDEYQMVLNEAWNGKSVGKRPGDLKQDIVSFPGLGLTPGGISLLKEITYCLGEFATSKSQTFVQPFLSGTAQEAVLKLAKPTSYTFHLLPCPLLSDKACFDIFSDVFPHCKRTDPITRLVSSTGGLPRALQYLLEVFTGSLEMHGDLSSSVEADYFTSTAKNLDKSYSISTFATENKELVNQLIYRFLYAIPCLRNYAPLPTAPTLTLEVLQRDTHTILEQIPGDRRVLVKIPNFFLYLYFEAFGHLTEPMKRYCLKSWDSEEFQSFERFVADFKMFRMNLLVDVGISNTTVGDFYHGARGQPATLQRPVLLNRLSKVHLAEARFPNTPLTLDWDEYCTDIVVLNATGASFADSCVFRHSIRNDYGTIFGNKRKLYDKTAFPISLVIKEHEKNISALRRIAPGSKLESMKYCDCITVIITIQNITGDVPDNCLVVDRNNFADFFGDAFALRASLYMDKKHRLDDDANLLYNKKHHFDDILSSDSNEEN